MLKIKTFTLKSINFTVYVHDPKLKLWFLSIALYQGINKIKFFLMSINFMSVLYVLIVVALLKP